MNDTDAGVDFSDLAVPVADLSAHLHFFLPTIHGLNQFQIQAVDKTAADLSRPGQLIFIGIEHLIQQDEFADLHRFRELFVDQAHFGEHEFLDSRLLGKIEVGCVGDHLLFRPVSGIPEIDVDHRRQKGASFSKDDRLLDERAEFQPGFNKIRRKCLSALISNNVFLAADNDQLAAAVQISGISGSEPSVGKCRLCRLIVLIIALKNRAARDKNFLVLRDSDLNAGEGFPDRLRLDFIIGLDLENSPGFGQSVTLLQVQSDGAKKMDHIRADRMTPRVGTEEI